jgi:hypothetical protein
MASLTTAQSPTEQKSLATLVLCLAILLLNVVDAMCTLSFLQQGFAEEANPLMRLAYRSSPAGFVLLKLAMVHAGVLILYIHRESKVARYALQSGVAAYVAIVSYEFAFVAHLFLRS